MFGWVRRFFSSWLQRESHKEEKSKDVSHRDMFPSKKPRGGKWSKAKHAPGRKQHAGKRAQKQRRKAARGR